MIGDDKNCILLVGYCQERSLGGRLFSGCKSAEIFGEDCDVRAEINPLGSMSAHEDSGNLYKFISGSDRDNLTNIFLVHDEFDIQRSFADRLKAKGYRVYIPAMFEEYIVEKHPTIYVEYHDIL
ncbi:MAG: hypothetical protein M3R50_06610 [Bacteroidota bacterium]|nr:hypothetical protein [Bacteroidota bacterium]